MQTQSLTVTNIEELAALKGLGVRRLTWSSGLPSVPKEILDYAPTVEILDLSRNALDSLPDWISELRSLRVLFLSGNRFREIPRVLGHLDSLRMLGMRSCQLEHICTDALPHSLVWLTLTDNHIQSIPESFGSLTRLRKLLLAGNRISELPQSCSTLRSLELLRLSANCFERFPDWLFDLPALTWLALAGNPRTSTAHSRTKESPTIPWSHLSLGAELGRGASGATYKALYTPPEGQAYEVAVKVFQSRVSSDGDACDEISAAVRAGRHPCLTSTIAQFSDHPENKFGLVLDLVPETFKNLAAPPSFESCTRDVYGDEMVLPFPTALEYGSQIASAASHLHEQGILHGDLYAHNILVDNSRALLSDFGAAWLYQGHTELKRATLERIEVRSIGILIEELLARVPAAERAACAEELTMTERLVHYCLESPVSNRPSCHEVAEELSAVAATLRRRN
jgi:hypothetical protein